MIPKLIHQTAKSRDLEPRRLWYVQSLKSLHPDWQYHLWTDEDNSKFVKDEYPELFETFTRLPKDIMRADVIRYLLMDKLGGFYCDTDYEMRRPFDLNHHDIVLSWETQDEFLPDRTYVGNAVFASVPGHPFWKMAIEDLAANPPMSPKLDVLTATGPGFLTRIYHRALAAGLSIHTTPRAMFSPRTPRNEREYQALLKDPQVYGIHHCFGSWREYTLVQRLRNRASSAVNMFR